MRKAQITPPLGTNKDVRINFSKLTINHIYVINHHTYNNVYCQQIQPDMSNIYLSYNNGIDNTFVQPKKIRSRSGVPRPTTAHRRTPH